MMVVRYFFQRFWGGGDKLWAISGNKQRGDRRCKS